MHHSYVAPKGCDVMYNAAMVAAKFAGKSPAEVNELVRDAEETYTLGKALLGAYAQAEGITVFENGTGEKIIATTPEEVAAGKKFGLKVVQVGFAGDEEAAFEAAAVIANSAPAAGELVKGKKDLVAEYWNERTPDEREAIREAIAYLADEFPATVGDNGEVTVARGGVARVTKRANRRVYGTEEGDIPRVPAEVWVRYA